MKKEITRTIFNAEGSVIVEYNNGDIETYYIIDLHYQIEECKNKMEKQINLSHLFGSFALALGIFYFSFNLINSNLKDSLSVINKNNEELAKVNAKLIESNAKLSERLAVLEALNKTK